MTRTRGTLLLAAITTLGMIWFFDTPSHNTTARANTDVHPETVAAAIAAGSAPTLLDVRTPEEHALSRLDGSILLPLQELSSASLLALGLEQSDPIYVYCRSGNRSMQAYEILSDLGYTNIKNVTGGVTLWESLGLPHLIR